MGAVIAQEDQMDKRLHDRKEIYVKAEVELQSFNEKKVVNALIYNISPGGVSFKINEKINHGDHCRISFGKGVNYYCFDGYIKGVRPIDGNNNSFKTGVKFTEEMQQNQFENMFFTLGAIGFK